MQPNSRTLVASIIALALSACSTQRTLNEAPLPPINYTLDQSLKRADQAYREARLSDAETIYREILDQHPTMGGVWFRLGNIYLRTTQFEAAVHAYEMAIRFDPQDSRPWYNLSLVRVKQALQILEQASVRLDPDDSGRQRIAELHDQLLARATTSPQGDK